MKVNGSGVGVQVHDSVAASNSMGGMRSRRSEIVHVFPVESTAVSVSESPSAKSSASKSAMIVPPIPSLTTPR